MRSQALEFTAMRKAAAVLLCALAAACQPAREAAAPIKPKVKTVIIPKGNQKDLAELPADLRRGLKFVPVESMDEVLELALIPRPNQNEATRVEGSTFYAH